jgi:hypothetical protein
MTELGPVQWIAASFPADAVFEGRVIAEIERLNASGSLRVLDVLFVRKDAETGELETVDAQAQGWGGLKTTRREIDDLGEDLEPGTGAALILIEHMWARDFEDALRSTRGTPIAQGYLPGEAVAELAAELGGR